MSARSKLLLVIAAAAVLALLMALLFQREATPKSAAAAPRSAAPEGAATRAAEPTEPSSNAPSSPTASTNRTATAPGATDLAEPLRLPTGRLDVHVVWADTHEPRAGEGVALVPIARGGLYFTREGRSDERGLIHFDRVEAGPVWVMGDRSGEVEARVEVGEVAEVTLEVARGLRVEGRVIAANGGSVSQPEVWLERDGRWRRIAECDSTQHFAIDGIAPGSYLAALAKDWSGDQRVRADGVEGSTLRIDLVVDRQGALVLGQVLDPNERPVAGALVAVEMQQMGRGFVKLGSAYVTGLTDDEGRFTLPGGGQEQRFVVSSPLFAPNDFVLDCSQPGARIQHIVRLEPGATLIGRVAQTGGAPARNVLISSGDVFVDALLARITVSDEKGNYKLTGLGAGLQKVRAGYMGASERAETELELTVGQTKVWNPVVPPPEPGDATSREK